MISKSSSYILLLVVFSACIKLNAQIKTVSSYFEFDSYVMSNETKQELTTKMEEFKNYNLTIKGYTDVVGSDSYNQNLSEKRVKSIKEFLISKGIDSKNIIEEKGLGESSQHPNHALNRRVDILFEVVKKAAIPIQTPVKTIEKPINKIDTVIKIEEPKIEPPIEKDISERISELKKGDKIVLEKIEFLPGRHFLMDYSQPELTNLLRTLKKYPNLKIEIQGHICCDHEGDDGYDFDTQTNDLSKNRAKYIYDFLIENGISKKRLSYKGFGSKKPLVEEITEADQQKNRRVEIEIVSN